MAALTSEDRAFLARHTSRLAAAIRVLARQNAQSGSPSSRDKADRSLDGPWGRPGDDLARRHSTLFDYAAIHISGTAALLHDPRTHLAALTTTRAALEPLATLHWLYDRRIEYAERARRAVNLAWRDDAETATFLGEPVVGPSVADTSHDAVRRTFPDQHFVSPRSRGSYWMPGRIGDAIPSATSLLSGVMDAKDAEGDVSTGATFYRITSAIAHGAGHIMPIWQTDAHGRVLVPLETFIRILHMTTHIAHVDVALYFGWDLEAWARTAYETATAMDDRFGRES